MYIRILVQEVLAGHGEPAAQVHPPQRQQAQQDPNLRIP